MSDERTTELREKLDELGIKHFDYDKGGRTQTMWESPEGMRHFTYETAANPAKTAKLTISWFPTPEQAIAATLGEKPRDRTEEWLLKACNRATQDYVAQLEQERDELKQLVRDLAPFVCADDGIEGIEARIKALGIEVIDE